jgi:cytochrome c peroxidase
MRKGVIFILAILGLAFTGSPHFKFPSYFPQPVYNFIENPLSQAKTDLGRALFYDPILSVNGMISCESCHSPFNAFAHTDHAVSHGINDSIGTRNAPALFNLAWKNSFMWDGAINHLDVQALAPINHPAEMGESTANVLIKLQKSHLYKKLFQKAWKDTAITSQRMLKSLSAFLVSLTSTQSKYDLVKQGKASFTAQESKGYALFKPLCGTCHTEPLFTNHQFANNGLILDEKFKDLGRYTVTQNPRDSFCFSVPSLRNLSYSYPYMHDGRFKTLYQVLNHYTSGIQASSTLHPAFDKSIDLSPVEKTDLVAFLLCLNDEQFVFDLKNRYPKNIFFPSKDK